MAGTSRSRRRMLLQSAALGSSVLSLPALNTAAADEEQDAAESAAVRGASAETCLFLWLGGGACHIDTWDPKRMGDGQKQAGSYYEPIPTSIPDVSVCEHLHRTAPLLDRAVIVRTVHHDLEDHQAATNRMHTGRPTSGTIQYPSIGSVVSHQRGPRDENVPPYVVVGYPNSTRDPGFLGSGSGYVYLTDTKAGPRGFQRPREITAERQERRHRLLETMRSEYAVRHRGDRTVENYASVSEQAFRLTGGQFMSVFDLAQEPDDLRNSYGGEFGQRCLLARRLVDAGARFVEVSFNLNFINGTGWDTHNEGQQKQHVLIQELDQALSTLLADLEQRKRLDSTLVVVATEFGRPPEFDKGGGRGHHPQVFSVLLAGGGLRSGRVVGATDELGREIVDRPVSVPDLHATIYTALGIDPSHELYDGSRPVPITDGGRAIAEVFS